MDDWPDLPNRNTQRLIDAVAADDILSEKSRAGVTGHAKQQTQNCAKWRHNVTDFRKPFENRQLSDAEL
jgi:hypothetical protein